MNVSGVSPSGVASPTSSGSPAHGRGAAAVDSPSSLHPKTLARLARASQPLPVAIALLSRADVARALGVSQLTILRWSKIGLLRSLKLGDGGDRAPTRYRVSDVAEFIESRLGAAE